VTYSASLQRAETGRVCYSLKQVQLVTRLELLKRKDEEFRKNTVVKLDAML